jgi:competence protein ComEC
MRRRSFLYGCLFVFVGLNLLVWGILFFSKTDDLVVSFLDVGQGDAILIETPSGVDLLIDGGRDRSVLREVGKRLGPFDRTIDIVLATHPDADHIGGLSEVFKRYDIDYFLSPGIDSDTTPAQALTTFVQAEKEVQVVEARRGQRIMLGNAIYADVLFPDRDVSTLETNTGSIILRLVYGETSFLLSGDAPSSVEDWLVRLDGSALQSDVLKAGHHGSRTSTSESWINTVDPDFVVISAGKDNSYGHPHQEVLERINTSGARVISTLGTGTKIFKSDGKTVRTP